jgi:hypothetical protein
MGRVRFAMAALAPWVLALPSSSALAGLERPPETACSYLAEEGLGSADRYREYRGGQFYCWSLRRPIAAGDPKRHEVRYEARGSAEQVSQLGLELHVFSTSEVQRAHKLFLGYVEALVRRALGEDPPPDLAPAVMAARPGRWPLGGAELVLEKRQVRASSYELVFRIE